MIVKDFAEKPLMDGEAAVSPLPFSDVSTGFGMVCGLADHPGWFFQQNQEALAKPQSRRSQRIAPLQKPKKTGDFRFGGRQSLAAVGSFARGSQIKSFLRLFLIIFLAVSYSCLSVFSSIAAEKSPEEDLAGYSLVLWNVTGTDVRVVNPWDNPVTSRMVRVTNGVKIDKNYRLSFSTNGLYLFLAGHTIRVGHILGDDKPRLIRLVGGERMDPEISPDGKRVVFVGRSEKGKGSTISVLNIESDKITEHASLQGQCYYPTWSPDGNMIVFYARDEEDGNLQNFYCAKVNVSSDNRAEIVKLTPRTQTISFFSRADDPSEIIVSLPVQPPQWVCGGDAIAFQGRFGKDWKGGELYVVDVATGRMIKMASSVPTFDFATTKSCLTVEFGRTNELEDTWVAMNVQGQTTKLQGYEIPLPNVRKSNPIFVDCVAFSPNGRAVAFTDHAALFLQVKGQAVRTLIDDRKCWGYRISWIRQSDLTGKDP